MFYQSQRACQSVQPDVSDTPGRGASQRTLVVSTTALPLARYCRRQVLGGRPEGFSVHELDVAATKRALGERMVPLPSAVTSLIMSCNSASVGF